MTDKPDAPETEDGLDWANPYPLGRKATPPEPVPDGLPWEKMVSRALRSFYHDDTKTNGERMAQAILGAIIDSGQVLVPKDDPRLEGCWDSRLIEAITRWDWSHVTGVPELIEQIDWMIGQTEDRVCAPDETRVKKDDPRLDPNTVPVEREVVKRLVNPWESVVEIKQSAHQSHLHLAAEVAQHHDDWKEWPDLREAVEQIEADAATLSAILKDE